MVKVDRSFGSLKSRAGKPWQGSMSNGRGQQAARTALRAQQSCCHLSQVVSPGPAAPIGILSPQAGPHYLILYLAASQADFQHRPPPHHTLFKATLSPCRSPSVNKLALLVPTASNSLPYDLSNHFFIPSMPQPCFRHEGDFTFL